MSSQYLKDGHTAPYTAGSDVAAGSFVDTGNLIGHCPRDIANGETAEVQVRGIVRVSKESATTFAAGAAVDWENTTGHAVATTTGDLAIGNAEAAAGAGQLYVDVRLNNL